METGSERHARADSFLGEGGRWLVYSTHLLPHFAGVRGWGLCSRSKERRSTCSRPYGEVQGPFLQHEALDAPMVSCSVAFQNLFSVFKHWKNALTCFAKMAVLEQVFLC